MRSIDDMVFVSTNIRAKIFERYLAPIEHQTGVMNMIQPVGVNFESRLVNHAVHQHSKVFKI